MTEEANFISIVPGVNILSLLARMDYKPWFALAEFVDNSIQSYLQHKEKIEEFEGRNFKLKVEIEFSPELNQIVIRDNAAGIYKSEYRRAFRPAEIPPDASGLSEFGLGMKSAACWFSPQWSVRTSALGEATKSTIEFDLEQILQEQLEQLPIQSTDTNQTSHFTEIILCNVSEKRMPKTQTIAKIRDHLKSIFRVFLKGGWLDLRIAGELQRWEELPILLAPPVEHPNGEEIYWRKELFIDLGCGQIVSGFAAILENDNLARAGFALLRRNRVIQGSADEPYRPLSIFGSMQSFRSRRLFGELHFEGFEVSHMKNGFIWEDLEEIFADFLKTELDKEPICLLAQTSSKNQAPITRNSIPIEVSEKTFLDIQTQSTLQVSNRSINDIEEATECDKKKLMPLRKEYHAILAEAKWSVAIDFNDEDEIGDWLSITNQELSLHEDVASTMDLRVALKHPFMANVVNQVDNAQLELISRIAVGLAIAEATARNAGNSNAGVIRRHLNKLLRECLSR